MNEVLQHTKHSWELYTSLQKTAACSSTVITSYHIPFNSANPCTPQSRPGPARELLSCWRCVPSPPSCAFKSSNISPTFRNSEMPDAAQGWAHSRKMAKGPAVYTVQIWRGSRLTQVQPAPEHWDAKDEWAGHQVVPLAGTDLGDPFLVKTSLCELLFAGLSKQSKGSEDLHRSGETEHPHAAPFEQTKPKRET